MTRAVKTFAFALLFSLFAFSVGAGVLVSQAASESSTAAPPTASNQFAIFVTTLAGFVSLLVTHIFQFYRDGRNRRWDLQDRTAARQEMRNHAETQRVETLKTAIELARVSNINREHLLGAIKENTDITTEAGAKAEAAYSSANNFNEKLEALRLELLDMAKKLPPDPPKET